MTNNRIGVTLDFKANTSQAKQAMQQLQQSLAQISSKGTLDLQFQKAAQAASELSFHLNNAYNADTGKLNLGKLTNSLNSSKQNLSALSKELLYIIAHYPRICQPMGIKSSVYLSTA